MFIGCHDGCRAMGSIGAFFLLFPFFGRFFELMRMKKWAEVLMQWRVFSLKTKHSLLWKYSFTFVQFNPLLAHGWVRKICLVYTLSKKREKYKCFCVYIYHVRLDSNVFVFQRAIIYTLYVDAFYCRASSTDKTPELDDRNVHTNSTQKYLAHAQTYTDGQFIRTYSKTRINRVRFCSDSYLCVCVVWW